MGIHSINIFTYFDYVIVIEECILYIYILSVLGSSLFIIAIVVIMINGFWTYTYSYILYIVAFIFAYEQRLPSVQTYMHVSTMHIFTYTPVHCYCRCCWRKESCTTKDVQDPVNNVINYLSTGAGFQASTVPHKVFTCATEEWIQIHKIVSSKFF